MASIETTVLQAEESTVLVPPHPTLRLVLSKDDFKKRCEEAKAKIVQDIKKVLDANADKVEELIESKTPKPAGKTPKEYDAELTNYEKALDAISILMEKQSSFNDELLKAVGDYLVESWKMKQKGADPESYKANMRKKLCNEFDKKTERVMKEIHGSMESGGPGQQPMHGEPGQQPLFGGPGQQPQNQELGQQPLNREPMYGGPGQQPMHGEPGQQTTYGGPGQQGSMESGQQPLFGGPGQQPQNQELGQQPLNREPMYGGPGQQPMHGEPGQQPRHASHGQQHTNGGPGQQTNYPGPRQQPMH